MLLRHINIITYTAGVGSDSCIDSFVVGTDNGLFWTNEWRYKDTHKHVTQYSYVRTYILYKSALYICTQYIAIVYF